jgi:cell division protein FtsQ
MGYFHKGRNKRKISIKSLLLLLIFLCIMAVMPLAYGPFFALENIEVIGNKNISTNEIKEKLSFYLGKNILKIKPKDVEKLIADSVPVKDVKVKYKLPHSLVIEVVERNIKAALPYLNGFALIDSYGVVIKLESRLENYSIPIVTGFNISDAKVAKQPVIDNPVLYKKLLTLIDSLSSFASELSEIHISKDDTDEDIIYLFTLDGLQIKLGNFDKAKISIIENVLNDVRKNSRGKGIIDLSSDTPVFIPLEKQGGKGE